MKSLSLTRREFLGLFVLGSVTSLLVRKAKMPAGNVKAKFWRRLK